MTLQNIRPCMTRYRKSVRYALHVMTHPFDGFWDLTHEHRGTFAAATTFLVMFLMTGIAEKTFTSFQFIDLSVRYLNVFRESASLLLPFLVVCVANWGMTTLFDGKGTLKGIYIAMCYALCPYILIRLPLTFLSQLLSFDEAQLYNVLNLLGVIWTLFLIVVGLMKTHDYTPGKTFVFIILTMLASLVILFLMAAFFSLLSDLWGFCVTIYREIVFRLY